MNPVSPSYGRLVMLGAEPETRGSVAAVVDAYRTHGLFQRWPIDYLPLHGERGAGHNAALTLGAARRLALLVARHRRVLVHMHVCARANAARDAAFMAAAHAMRSPLIVQLHGAGLERSHGGALTRRLLASAACVLIPSESMRPWVRSVARDVHTECLPAPVAAAAPAPHGTRPNLILFLGRLEASKGIFDLLEAVGALRATIPDVRLVCAGDGERIAVARYAERLGIADAVKFTGWIGPSGKRALLETAAVFALPSYDEALPVGLCEAMAAGVPAVASPVGGIPEVLTDGVSGCLVAPGDKASLERSLRRLLTDRALAARLGAAARETARLRFAPERTLGRLEEIYAALGLRTAAEAVARPVDLRQAA